MLDALLTAHGHERRSFCLMSHFEESLFYKSPTLHFYLLLSFAIRRTDSEAVAPCRRNAALDFYLLVALVFFTSPNKVALLGKVRNIDFSNEPWLLREGIVTRKEDDFEQAL